MPTLRETVMRMPADERLEYALACWEMLTCEDVPLRREIDGTRLTQQQARIFAMLSRSNGRAVPGVDLVAMLDANRDDAETTLTCIRTQISFMRRKLAGKYRIHARRYEGYTLEAVARAPSAAPSPVCQTGMYRTPPPLWLAGQTWMGRPAVRTILSPAPSG